jgi:hypothetical protein
LIIKEPRWKKFLHHSKILFSQLPRKRLPQHRLRQPLAPPARRRNLAIDRIRTLEQQTDTPDDLMLLGSFQMRINPRLPGDSLALGGHTLQDIK